MLEDAFYYQIYYETLKILFYVVYQRILKKLYDKFRRRRSCGNCPKSCLFFDSLRTLDKLLRSSGKVEKREGRREGGVDEEEKGNTR